MDQPLIQAVQDENIDLVRQLLQQGADPNCFEDDDRVTPLHFVVQKKSATALQIARLLLYAGANPQAAIEPDGQTPLDVARLMTNDAMVLLLSEFMIRTTVSH